jgi:hypothetical protein
VTSFHHHLKRSTQNLQLSTTTRADYPIHWHKADNPIVPAFVRFRTISHKSRFSRGWPRSLMNRKRSWPLPIFCLRDPSGGLLQVAKMLFTGPRGGERRPDSPPFLAAPRSPRSACAVTTRFLFDSHSGHVHGSGNCKSCRNFII